MHNYNGNFFGMHGGSWIFWILIAVVVYYFLINNRAKNPNVDTPMEILKKRLAAGEITKEEFEKLKETLKQ